MFSLYYTKLDKWIYKFCLKRNNNNESEGQAEIMIQYILDKDLLCSSIGYVTYTPITFNTNNNYNI